MMLTYTLLVIMYPPVLLNAAGMVTFAFSYVLVRESS